MAVKDTVTRILITAKDEASGVFGTLQRNAGKVAAAIVGFFGVKLFAGATESAEGLDVQMRKLDAAVRATGGAAGLTAEEIDQMARRLDEATLGSAAGFRDAAAQLLTFKSVGSDAFETVLELAQDLADTGFGTLETNVVQLGKALEDPIRGLTALRRSGVSFTAEQEAVIKSLVETGRAAEAQGLILEAVSGQVGGVARSMGTGLSGAVDLVKARFTELQQQLGAAILPSLQDFNNRIADLYGRLRDSGAIERFGQIIASVFEKAQQSFFAFIDQIDLDALIAKLTAWANATQQTVATWAESLTAASNVARVTFGAIETGLDTLKAAFFGVAGVVATFAQNLTGAFASVIETINNVTGKFGEAAAEARAISNSFGDSARQNFEKAAEALDDATDSARNLRQSFADLNDDGKDTAFVIRDLNAELNKAPAAARNTTQALQSIGRESEATAEKISELRRKYQEFIAAGDTQNAAGVQQQITDLQNLGNQAGETGENLEQAGEGGKKAAEGLKDAGDGAKDAADGAEDAENATQKLGGSLNDTVAIARLYAAQIKQLKAEIAGYSEAALRAVEAAYDSAIGFTDASRRIQSLTANAQELIAEDAMGGVEQTFRAAKDEAAALAAELDEMQSFDSIFGAGLAFAGLRKYIASLQEMKVALAEAKANLIELDVEVESFNGAVEQNTLSLREQEEALLVLIARAEQLGSQQLSGLRSALANVQRQMDTLADSAQATLNSLLDELDQIEGRYEAIEKRRREQQREEIQAQLGEARAAGDQNAIRLLTEALRTLERVQNATLKEARERERGQSGTSGTSGTTRTSESGSASPAGPVSITINDARDPEKVARQVAKELDKIRRFAK